MRLTRRYYMECAHQLSGLRHNHKCMRMHGHSYIIELTIVPQKQQADEGRKFEFMQNGMIIDTEDLDIIFMPILKKLDHTILNESLNDGTEMGRIASQQPTGENIAAYLWERLGFMKIDPRFRLVNVRLYETTDMWVDVGQKTT